MIKKVCVFCGSNIGKSEVYARQVKAFAESLTRHEIDLVYGGGNVGLMGLVAQTILESQGEVIGIIPKKIYELVEQIELTELHITENMHERKAMMYDLADGFIALPGGIGTLEELAEVLTWQQLGYHQKPVGVLNVNGFYDKLVGFLQHGVEEGFIKQDFVDSLIVESDPDRLIERMQSFQPSGDTKWGIK